jgi:toxin ParE1/3/4
VAKADLAEIWEYIGVSNAAAADKLLDTINDKIHSIANSPFMGRERSELAPMLRSFQIAQYVLFYRPITEGIEIVPVPYLYTSEVQR